MSSYEPSSITSGQLIGANYLFVIWAPDAVAIALHDTHLRLYLVHISSRMFTSGWRPPMAFQVEEGARTFGTAAVHQTAA